MTEIDSVDFGLGKSGNTRIKCHMLFLEIKHLEQLAEMTICHLLRVLNLGM